MTVSITPKFSKEQIERIMAKKVTAIEQAILLRLQRVGEQFVTNARNNGSYRDVTGNLRASIGYVVLRNGAQVSSAFPGKTNAGRSKAKQVIDDAALKFQRGLVLICVAGMDYAAAVEAKGRDVLTASSIQAKEDLKKSIAELKEKIG